MCQKKRKKYKNTQKQFNFEAPEKYKVDSSHATSVDGNAPERENAAKTRK